MSRLFRRLGTAIPALLAAPLATPGAVTVHAQSDLKGANGATGLGTEPLHGQIADLPYATLKPDRFDPGADFQVHGNTIHRRRPGGRGPDYCFHVNAAGKEKGPLRVAHPLDQEVRQTPDIPLHSTGLTGTAKVRERDGAERDCELDRGFNVNPAAKMPAKGFTRFVVE